MTISSILINNPKLPDESDKKYFDRIIAINPELNRESVRRVFYKYKNTIFVPTKRKVVGGEVVSETLSLRSESLLDVDLPIHRVSTNVATGQQWVIQQKSNTTDSLNIEVIIKDAVESLDRTPVKFKKSKNYTERALFNIITDVHAGMEVTEGFLDYDWNSTLLIKSFQINLDKVVSLVDLYGKVDKLYLMDLGDTLDGYEGFTTRGEHKLPQNMTTTEQFSLVLNTYLSYIENILENDLCDELVVYRVENDNHSGSFGKLLGMTLEALILRMYPKAKVTFKRQSKFIDTLNYGDNYILTTHGKDSTYMKQGMPLILNAKWVEYVNSIIKRNNLLGKNVSLYKGDLHQIGLSSHTLFKYYNFPAFSPPSGWVQHNYGDPCDIGYAIHMYSKNNKDRVIINETFDFH